MTLDDLPSTAPRRVNLRHLAELAGYKSLTDAIQVNRWNGDTSVDRMEDQLQAEAAPHLTTIPHEIVKLRIARRRALSSGFSGLARALDWLIRSTEGCT